MATTQASEAATEKGLPLGMDVSMVDEYASQSKLLQEFVKIPTIGNAWIFNSKTGMCCYCYLVLLNLGFLLFFSCCAENTSRAIVSVGQTDLLANKKRSFLLNSHISKNSSNSVDFQWSSFPIEMSGVSAVIPSPSGRKLLLIRNSEDDSPTKLEVWGPCQLENEIHIAQSVHGSLYVDEWLTILPLLEQLS